MATVMAIDKLEFNATRGNYRELISKIRSAMQEPGRFSHNRPVMPPQNKAAAQGWLDLALSTDNNRTVTLRIRRENHYLDGYMLKRDGVDVWYEFKNEKDTQLIPGSSFLDFDGSYDGLKGGGGGALSEKTYSRSSVLSAIEGLSKFDAKSEDKASYLILMIVLVCEASRFEKISSLFADAMHSKNDEIKVVIDAKLVDLIHGWGDLSGFMLKADAFGGQTFRLPVDNKLRPYIGNATEAAAYVGLLLGSEDYRQANLRVLTTSAVPAGQPLVEVLSVQLLIASTRLSGTITVADGLGSQTLFTGGNQAVNRGDTLTLNTLQRAISAAMFFEMSYNLATPALLSGHEYWSIFQTTDSYARPITGGNASLALSYVIFPDAWQLTWEAKIVAGGVSGNAPVNVFGTVTASYTYNGTKYETVLFSRLAGNSVQVQIGGNMPLLRLAAAVPVGVDVIVKVSLSDRVTASSNRLIAQGQATFQVGVGNAWNGSNVLPFTGMGGGSVNVSAAYSRVSQPPN